MRSPVLLVLQICLVAAVLSVDVLPQTEMRELDIFMQNEGYQQISRTKRRDDDIQEQVEYSGDEPPAESELTNITENPPNSSDFMSDNGTQTDGSYIPPPPHTLENSGNDADSSRNTTTVAENADSNFETNTKIPSEDVVDSNSKNVTVENKDLNSNNEAEAAPAENTNPSTNNAEISTTISPTTEHSASPNISPGFNSEDNTNASGVQTTDDITAAKPPGYMRSGVQDVSVIENGTQDASPRSDLTVGGNATDISSVNATQNITDTQKENILPDNVNNTVNATGSTNTTNTINSTDTTLPTTNTTTNITNSTTINDKPEKPAVNSTSTNTTILEATPSTPTVGESDQTTQSSVSGTTVLFTIIILVAIAALGAIGYTMYKRRTVGYDPVNVEDQDKEMIEIKTENGMGKPIKEDEVRIENQLTPTQPMPTQRTFAVTPTEERKLRDSDLKLNESEAKGQKAASREDNKNDE